MQGQNSTTNGDPFAALSDFVAQWKKMIGESSFEAGCPITAAAMAGPVAPAAAATAGAVFDTWHTLLAEALIRYDVPAPRATTLANTIVAAVQGAVVMAIAQQTMTALTDVEQELAVLLSTAVH